MAVPLPIPAPDRAIPHPTDGVLFARSDCAGISRRIFAGVVDLAVVLLFGAFWWPVCFLTVPDPGIATSLWVGSVFIAASLYFAGLKRTELCTVGYRLAGIRVVGLDGEPPRLWPMFVRFAFCVVWLLTGSTLFLVDLFWIGGDEQRQTIRDKLAGTVVIRRAAKPVARGRQAVRFYTFVGLSLFCREVKAEP